MGSNERFYVAASIVAFWALLVFPGCATGPGDELPCPVCEDGVEILVGTVCMPADHVPECGPLGSLNEEFGSCECEDGNEPVVVAGVEHCLQDGCVYEHSGDEEGEHGHGH